MLKLLNIGWFFVSANINMKSAVDSFETSFTDQDQRNRKPCELKVDWWCCTSEWSLQFLQCRIESFVGWCCPNLRTAWSWDLKVRINSTFRVGQRVKIENVAYDDRGWVLIMRMRFLWIQTRSCHEVKKVHAGLVSQNSFEFIMTLSWMRIDFKSSALVQSTALKISPKASWASVSKLTLESGICKSVTSLLGMMQKSSGMMTM